MEESMVQSMEIAIRGVAKTFQDGTTALQPIDLHVEAGEVLVLLGPSGCGKSTLLRMIAGLEQPTAGRIVIGDRDVTQLPPEKRGIGFVFQQYALFPTMTVEENIAFGMKLRKIGRQEQKAKLDELLALMNLTELRKRLPIQLSGGQQQRVAIARVLATDPMILLMDEPLTALDAKLKEHLRLELAQLFRKLHITTVYVTHDQTEAMAIADRIVVMNKGVIEQSGTPKEIYLKPKSSFVAQFVGQVNRLRAKVKTAERGDVLDLGFYQLPYKGESRAVADIDVFLRPEDVYLTQDAGFSARVQDVIFLGDHYRVIAESGGQKLVIDVGNDTLIREGDQVQLEIREDKIIYA
ncbi:ABC transporter ATP-binding protein [Brevibacillus parabrevis]|uniref:ABC transporter ATP-binding protein n=1 Tax=Brevibacillus parabrevis TaxID=54914 RepID=UPI000B2E108B|nr:ABC transporter ATP-binding protein [Brevibacillus parabrevis]